jgi:hypothetical protein
MIRAKMLAVLAGMIATLAITAVPASAEFQSKTTKGNSSSGAVVLEGGGGTLECSSTEGEWTILNASKEAATKGSTLSLNIKKFNGCKVKSSEVKEAKPVVKECTLHLTQAAGETKAKGSVATECTVKTTILFFTCVLTVPIEKESPRVNFGLETNILSNSGQNQIVEAADTGITTEAKGVCPGIKNTTEGKQKATVTNQAVKEV